MGDGSVCSEPERHASVGRDRGNGLYLKARPHVQTESSTGLLVESQ